jgi:hypothetical protein
MKQVVIKISEEEAKLLWHILNNSTGMSLGNYLEARNTDVEVTNNTPNIGDISNFKFYLWNKLNNTLYGGEVDRE